MKKTNVSALIWGILLALAASLLLAAVAAALVGAGTLPAGSLSCVSWVITFAAGLVGGYGTARKAGKLRLPLSVAGAALYLLVVFVLRGLLFRTVGPQPWWIPIFTLAGAVIGALIASGNTKKKRRLPKK